MLQPVLCFCLLYTSQFTNTAPTKGIYIIGFSINGTPKITGSLILKKAGTIPVSYTHLKAKYNPWGSEIYPDTIYDMLKDIKQMYGDIPVYITESGIGTYDELNAEGKVDDDYRIEILEGWVDGLLRAKAEGCNAVSYTHLDVYKRQGCTAEGSECWQHAFHKWQACIDKESLC